MTQNHDVIMIKNHFCRTAKRRISSEGAVLESGVVGNKIFASKKEGVRPRISGRAKNSNLMEMP